MSVRQPRTRLVYCRLSEDEFQRLTTLYQNGGARSISELARQALQRLISESQLATEEPLEQKLKTIDGLIGELSDRLKLIDQYINDHRIGGEMVVGNTNGSSLRSPMRGR